MTLIASVNRLNLFGRNPSRLLIVAATELEVAPLLKEARLHSGNTTRTGRQIMEMRLGRRHQLDPTITPNSMPMEGGTKTGAIKCTTESAALPQPSEIENEITFTLAITGVGSINAAHAVTQSIEQCRPDLIIQIGIGGAFESAGLSVGDIAVAKSDTDIHVGVEHHPYPHYPLPFDLIPDQPNTRNGYFQLDPELSENAFKLLIRNVNINPTAHQIVRGDFISVSTITATSQRARTLSQAFSPCMESMEGAAVSHVASLYALPFLQIRSASNMVGVRDRSQWDIPLAVNRVCGALKELLSQW